MGSLTWFLTLLKNLLLALAPPAPSPWKDKEIEYIPPMPSLDNDPHVPVEVVAPRIKTKGEILYDVAYLCLGKDMSPQDKAPDSLGCAESLNGVYRAAFGKVIGTGAALTGTAALYQVLKSDKRFLQVYAPMTGDIVISPTGSSTKGAQHGHCGIWGNYDVMSNDSNSGLWSDNYSHNAWYNVFNKTLGFPVFFFRPVHN